MDPAIIVGRVGRQIALQENEPPEAGLQETVRESWRAAALLIDPRPHDDGQKAALEHDPRVGHPIALFESITNHLNARADPPSPFVIEVNPISDPADFWDFVREYKGEITTVVFELVAPNMFGIENDYDAELREMRETERVRRIKLEN